MRLEQQTARRGNASVVVTTMLSLLVVAVAVAAVAWLVFRSPSEAVDSAERLEPVGTALPAPTEEPTLPTPSPTQPSQPAAPGFTGEAPGASGLPTVESPREAESLPQDAGPTPTPRVVALPTAPAEAPPPTLPAAQPTPLPAPTLPPSVPVEAVPVVALEPVEVAQPAPTAAAPDPAADESDREPRSQPVEVDDDPFNIFGDGDGNGSRIMPAQNDALERARSLQNDDERGGSEPAGAPTDVVTITEGRNGSMEIVVPDVDAMIEEITAQVTDPNRNPNVGNPARSQSGRDREPDDPDDSARERASDGREPAVENRRRSARERISDRNRRPVAPASRANREVLPPIQNGSGPIANQGGDECNSSFENLPEDRRPQGFPFDDC
jgi:hypothetical protein